MREIKFRAWNKEKKEMRKDVDTVGRFYTTFDRSDGRFRTNEEVEIMQFTGLQDENGVDIYEGDIINLSYEYFDGHFRDNEIVGKVYFEDSSFRMSYKKYDEIREWRIDEPEILSIEVIGNIYENPELLEV